jgi:putative membrane protein
VRRSAIVAIVVGLALVAVLLAFNDVGRITALLVGTGWAILIPTALHMPQTFLSGMGWGPLLGGRYSAGLLYRWRWVRESVNTLLPVAQVGGDVVRVRLAVQRGMHLSEAIAASLVDISVELVGQVLFTLLGVGLLVWGPHGEGTTTIAWAAAAAVAVFAGAMIAAQRLGAIRLIERAVARWSSSTDWGVRGDLSGLHDDVVALYRQPSRLLASGLFHLGSWLAGIVETYAALWALGLDPTWREAAVIESLGQAVRACGFLIPGALGVQEGGMLLIGALFGIGGPQALALSLVRRVRELALGLPGLALWHRMERPLPTTAARGTTR